MSSITAQEVLSRPTRAEAAQQRSSYQDLMRDPYAALAEIHAIRAEGEPLPDAHVLFLTQQIVEAYMLHGREAVQRDLVIALIEAICQIRGFQMREPRCAGKLLTSAEGENASRPAWLNHEATEIASVLNEPSALVSSWTASSIAHFLACAATGHVKHVNGVTVAHQRPSIRQQVVKALALKPPHDTSADTSPPTYSLSRRLTTDVIDSLILVATRGVVLARPIPATYVSSHEYHLLKHEAGDLALSLQLEPGELAFTALLEFHHLRFEHAVSGFLALDDLMRTVHEVDSDTRRIVKSKNYLGLVTEGRDGKPPVYTLRMLSRANTVAAAHLTQAEIDGLRDLWHGVKERPDMAKLLGAMQHLHGDI